MPKNLWKPGKSGNPAGRPPKERALTHILETAGSKTIDDQDKRASRKQVLARLVWEVATTGKALMPDGATLQVDPKDWFDVTKFLYQHIDGPPKTSLDITSDGGPIQVTITRKAEGSNSATPDD